MTDSRHKSQIPLKFENHIINLRENIIQMMSDRQKIITIVIDSGKDNSANLYRDTPLSGSSTSPNYDASDIPKEIREMMELYDFKNASLYQKSVNFYRQGKFMENYEDDFPWKGKFQHYFPTYHDLNIPQLRGYFTWRTRLRKGEYLPIPTSMAYIYIYELLNGIGTSSVEESLWRMQEFETEFLETGICDPNIQDNLHRWMTELAIIHQLPKKKVLHYIDPYDIQLTHYLEILRNPANRTDDEIFMALRHFWERKIESSPVIRMDAVAGKHLFAEVWRIASSQPLQNGKDLFTNCFGEQTEFSWYPLANAVYLERRNLTDISYELNSCLRYRYHHNAWNEETFKELYFRKEKIKELVHVTDLMLRRYLKKSPYLREKPEEAWAIPYVEAVIEADRQAKIEAARPKIDIDLTRLGQIRAAAVVTRDSLLTEEDLLETGEEKVAEKISVPETMMADADTLSLDPTLRKIVAALLEGRPVQKLMASNRLMPSIVTDTINEAFFDDIGDNILECEGEKLSLVEDYIEDVKAIIRGHVIHQEVVS